MKNFTKWDVLAVLVIAFVPSLIEWSRHLLLDVPVQGDAQPYVYFCMGFLYSLLVTSSLYFGCLSIMYYLNKKLPWGENVAKRLIVEIVLMISYATAVQVLILLMYSLFSIYDHLDLNFRFYVENVFFGNTITIIVIALVEGVYFFRRWKESLLLAEKMKSENMASQLNSLKAQLDPHFLFNSLNVLSSLIKKDTEKAESFVEDFAKVYRYVLEVKDEMVVMLNQELKFLESYASLQKIRFGDALILSVQLNPRPMILYLPPLSLQELLTNAVKHNEVSKERPLKIEIFNQGDTLVVRNNLQRRDEETESMGVGLDNIQKRYSLLSDKVPTFELTEEHFVAKIPLLETEN